ncbi:MAG TPA: lipid-binding SYLF domain-containing protein [Caulobacteraceae bacterium]|jgi:lipid-binding SYLF domain-containing protein
MKTLQVFALALIAMLALSAGGVARAASASEISGNATATLNTLYGQSTAARALGVKARGILVFSRITKAGFIIGGQGGDGALLVGGRTAGYYRSVAASYGLQAGVQTFSYVLFLMTPSAVNYLKTSNGWELGTGPSFVVVDKGMAKSMSTTTLKKDVYAFIFGQKGLMAGLGLQGTKITQIHPN